MTMTHGSDIYYDPFDIEIDKDPHPLWKRMRDEMPLYRNEKFDFWAVSRFGPSRGALISYLAPVAGLLFAFIVLGDQPAPVQLAGAVIILTGVRVLAVAPRATAVRVPGPILPA